MKRRSWIGIPGKLKGDGTSQDGDGDEQTEMVYVGAGIGRYHLFRDCHYISNEYMTVTRSEAENGKVPGEKRTPVPSAGKREMDRRPSISRRQASTITAIKIAGL